MTVLLLKNSALWQEWHLCKLSSDALAEFCSRLYRNEFLSLQRKDGGFPAFFTAAVTGRPPGVTPDRADHPTCASIHSWTATAPAVSVWPAGGGQPQPLLHLHSRDGRGNHDRASPQAAAGKEKSRQKSDPKEKRRTLYQKCIKNALKYLISTWDLHPELFRKDSPSHAANEILLARVCACFRETNALPV